MTKVYKMNAVYKIDVKVYHWDNDHYEAETKVLCFSSLDEAFKAQSYLKWLPYSNEGSFAPEKSFGFHSRELDEKLDFPLVMLDIWHGGVFKSDFEVYTEQMIRTVYRK